jgi:hypothetical protein
MPKYNGFISTLEKPQKQIFVYGLCDPNTKQLRYIGITIQGFHRIREHFYKSEKKSKISNCLSPSQSWINKLKIQNKIFEVVYLEYFDNEFGLDDAERFYIEYFRSIGASLLNVELGGKKENGITTDERKRISQKTKEAMARPEVRQKLINSHVGQASHNKGKKVSPEVKNKISKAQEARVVYIQDNLGNIYRGYQHAADSIGCSQSGINNCINGRAKTIKGRTLKRVN